MCKWVFVRMGVYVCVYLKTIDEKCVFLFTKIILFTHNKMDYIFILCEFSPSSNWWFFPWSLSDKTFQVFRIFQIFLIITEDGLDSLYYFQSRRSLFKGFVDPSN